MKTIQIVTAFFVVSAALDAEVARYTQKELFMSHSTNLRTITFDDLERGVPFPAPRGLTKDGVNFVSSVAAQNDHIWIHGPNDSPAGVILSSGLKIRRRASVDEPGLIITLPANISAVSMIVASDRISSSTASWDGLIDITVVTAAGTSQPFRVATSPMPGNPALPMAVFVGFASDSTITSLRFKVPNGIYLDDFAFGQVVPPAITSTNGVANAASLQAGIAPNTWISIFGENLSQTTRTWETADFQSNKLPAQLDGISVTVNGKPAYISYISPTQINALAPVDTATGMVEAVVSRSGVRSRSIFASTAALSPAVFRFNAANGRYAAATHVHGAYVGPLNLYPGLSLPAKPGDVIVLWANGLGTTNPPIPDGQVVSQAATLVNSVIVRFGAIQAEVLYAGLTATGLYQLNVRVPETVPDGDVKIQLAISGFTSADTASVYIQR